MNHERKDGLTAFIDERKNKTSQNKFIYIFQNIISCNWYLVWSPLT